MSDSLCPLDCSLPGSSVHGMSQDTGTEYWSPRILEWVAISFSRGSSQLRDSALASALQADTLPSEPPGNP